MTVRAVLALAVVLTLVGPVLAGPLRIVSYNIRNGASARATRIGGWELAIPFGGPEIRLPGFDLPISRGNGQLDQVAEALRGLEPDIVLLQEVEDRSVESLGQDQAAYLARKTGWQNAYHACNKVGWFGFLNTKGNAILSRHPMSEVAYRQLSEPGEGPGRGVITARLAVPGVPGGVRVASTHLSVSGAGGQRAGEVRALAGFLRSTEGPLVVGGDFNEKPGGPDVALLHEGMAAGGNPLADGWIIRGQGSPETYSVLNPKARIDYLLHSQTLAPRSVFVARDVRASDHFPLVGDYELVGAAAASVGTGHPATSLLGVGAE